MTEPNHRNWGHPAFTRFRTAVFSDLMQGQAGVRQGYSLQALIGQFDKVLETSTFTIDVDSQQDQRAIESWENEGGETKS